MARTRVNRYENGEREPDEATARRLAEALGMPLAALYADSPTMAKLIAAISQLNEHEQAALLGKLAKSQPQR